MKNIFIISSVCLTLALLIGCSNDTQSRERMSTSSFSVTYETAESSSEEDKLIIYPEEIFENAEAQLTKILQDNGHNDFLISKDSRNLTGKGVEMEVYVNYPSENVYTDVAVVEHVNQIAKLIQDNFNPIVGLCNISVSNSYVSSCYLKSDINSDWVFDSFEECKNNNVDYEGLNTYRKTRGMPIIKPIDHPDYNSDGEYKPAHEMSQDEIEQELIEMLEDKGF